MQTIRIFFSASETDPRAIVERAGPVLDVDLTPMRSHYDSLGQHPVKKMEAFLRYWEEEGKTTLSPRARIARIDSEAVRDVLPPQALSHFGKADILVLAIWTLGEELERESSRIMGRKGSMMQGLLLDVAGSLALYDMHNLLLDWLAREPAFGGRHVADEYYLGAEGDPQALMQRIERLGETAKWLGVEARGSSMFHPRKTQCAFVCLGEEKRPFRRTVLPCQPCDGKRCLYYQLGGCHLGIIKGSDGLSLFGE